MTGSKQKTIRFTEGSVIGRLALFALPIICSELLQNLYNSVDSMVAGKCVGGLALAAVNTCTPIASLFVGFFNGMSIGNTVVVARAFGSGDRERTEKAIRYATTFSVFLGVLVSLLGILTAGALLRFSGCDEELYGEAIHYLRVYLAGIMFTVIYNCGTGILRAIGDSRRPLYILAGTSTLNIGLDLLFVKVFHLGTMGLALATVLAQGLSMLLVLYMILRQIGSRPIAPAETWRDGRRLIWSSMSIGVSAGIQSALIAISNIFVQTYVNQFSTAVIAGVGVGLKIDRFVILPCKSTALTITTYVSQNTGAGKYGRAKKGILYGLGMSAVVTVAMVGAIVIFAEPIVRCFSDDPEILRVGVDMIRFIAPWYFTLLIRENILSYMRGYGISTTPMILTLAGMIGTRQLYLWLALRPYQPLSVLSGELYGQALRILYSCYPVGWGASALLLVLYFALRVRKMWRQAEAEENRG